MLYNNNIIECQLEKLVWPYQTKIITIMSFFVKYVSIFNCPKIDPVLRFGGDEKFFNVNNEQFFIFSLDVQLGLHFTLSQGTD